MPVLTRVTANAVFSVSQLGVKDSSLVASNTAKELLDSMLLARSSRRLIRKSKLGVEGLVSPIMRGFEPF